MTGPVNAPALRDNPWGNVAPIRPHKSTLAVIPEPPKGTVLTFSKRYDGTAQSYAFAALKVRRDQWSITGRETGLVSWIELLELIGDGAKDGLGWRTIRFATGWESPTQ